MKKFAKILIWTVVVVALLARRRHHLHDKLAAHSSVPVRALSPIANLKAHPLASPAANIS